MRNPSNKKLTELLDNLQGLEATYEESKRPTPSRAKSRTPRLEATYEESKRTRPGAPLRPAPGLEATYEESKPTRRFHSRRHSSSLEATYEESKLEVGHDVGDGFGVFGSYL